MLTTPTTEPTSLVAGETWKWDKTLRDFPSPEFTLTYNFIQQSANPAIFTIVATDDAGTHAINVTATVSSAFIPGDYSYQGFATKGADKFLAVTGEMEVEQNFDGSTTDPRSDACKKFDALTAAMAGSASNMQLSYSIDGMSVVDINTTDKIALIEYYRKICESEAQAVLVENNKRTNKLGFFRFRKVQ